MKIIAFAGSNSAKSINQQLISYAASITDNTETIRLTDYEIPIYNFDTEEENGIPGTVQKLNEKLAEADAFIISVNEHNGNISAYFKNILDWLSRDNRSFLANKKIVLLSTSPGKGGGASALQIAKKTLPYFGAEIVASLSVPNFYDNMKDEKLINTTINSELQNVLTQLT